MNKIIKVTTIVLTLVFVMTISFESNAVPLSKLKHRVLYTDPPLQIYYVGGALWIYAPEPELIGWQDYCGFALSSCDESQEMIVLDDVDGVFR